MLCPVLTPCELWGIDMGWISFREHALVFNLDHVRSIEVIEGSMCVRVGYSNGENIEIPCLSDADALIILDEIRSLSLASEIKLTYTAEGNIYLLDASSFERLDLWTHMGALLRNKAVAADREYESWFV